MRAARCFIAAACLAATGCATQPANDSALTPASTMTGSDSQDRVRARVHTELAGGYYELGNISVALEEAREALRSDVNYGPAYNIIGLIYARLNEDRLADESFQRALRINPNDYDAHHNYGSFLCERKQVKSALEHFLAAVRNPLYPLPDRSYVNAGVCARRSGDFARAEEYFQQALKASPAQPQALYQLADLSYARGDFGATKAYLGRLTKSVMANPEVLWLGVRVERKLGDRNAEASYASQLRNRFPDSREARLLGAGQFE